MVRPVGLSIRRDASQPVAGGGLAIRYPLPGRIV